MNRHHAQNRARRLLEPVLRRLRLIATKGAVANVDDSTRIQRVQARLFKNEARWCQRFQPLGLTAVPLLNSRAEHVTLFLGGSRELGVVVQVDDGAVRPKDLAPGEAAFYEPVPGGSIIRFLANGDVLITPRSGKLLVDGDVEATGEVADALGPMTEMRTTYNGHVHVEQGGTGPTLPPTPPMV